MFDQLSPPSYLRRSSETRRAKERGLLAGWIAQNRELIAPGARIFSASGTTSSEATALILQQVPEVHVWTNSIPVAWKFMELVEEGLAAPHVAVSLCGGDVRAVTGAVAGKHRCEKSASLIFSPHGLTDKGVVGDRDVDQLRLLVSGHMKIIMPISWYKLNRDGKEIVKHYGHWKKQAGRRCDLVLLEEPPEELGISGQRLREAERLLSVLPELMGSSLVIHRVPSHFKITPQTSRAGRPD